jgi:Trypsin
MGAPRRFRIMQPVSHVQARGPLTPSQLVAFDNVVADQRMPAAMAELLARQRHYVSVPDGKLDLAARMKRHADLAGVWELDAPARTFAGLSGRSADTVAGEAMRGHSTGDGRVAAFRPPWVDHIFHPKLSGRPDGPSLRTRDGGRIQTTDGSRGVYGIDNRQLFHPGGYPWHCIGRVLTSLDPAKEATVLGTGVLVGPRHVLTAAHLMPWGSPSWKIAFLPGYYDGQPVPGVGSGSWVSDYRLDPQAFRVGARDMALLRLYDPLGDVLGYFGAHTYQPAWQDEVWWMLVGYPREVSDTRPSAQGGIAVVGHEADGDFMELKHFGDATGGDSGGPLFATWDDGFPYVIGVLSGNKLRVGGGRPDEDVNVCAGGGALSTFINYWRENWP